MLGGIRMFDSITQGYIIQELLTELPSILACIGGIVLAVTIMAASTTLLALRRSGVWLDLVASFSISDCLAGRASHI